MHSNLIKLFQPRLRKNSPSAVQSSLRKRKAVRALAAIACLIRNVALKFIFPLLVPNCRFHSEWKRRLISRDSKLSEALLFSLTHTLCRSTWNECTQFWQTQMIFLRVPDRLLLRERISKENTRRRWGGVGFYFWPATNCSNKFSFIVPDHRFILRPIQNWSKWVRKCVFTHCFSKHKSESIILADCARHSASCTLNQHAFALGGIQNQHQSLERLLMLQQR